MFFYLSKVLEFFISPLIWVIILLAFVFFIKNIKWKKVCFILAFVFLLLFSNPFLFSEAMRAWEAKPTQDTELKVHYDYAIVLTGMIAFDNDCQRLNFLRSSDRIFQALRLYHKSYFDKFYISGGSGFVLDQDFKESYLLKNYLVDIGVPEEDIVIEINSKNTYENAVEARKSLKPEENECSYLLITSASHLPRASKCFEKQGFVFDIYATDRYVTDRRYDPYHLFIPNMSSLAAWSALLHEIAGYIMYDIVGYF